MDAHRGEDYVGAEVHPLGALLRSHLPATQERKQTGGLKAQRAKD
jgi:hypothetical protein